VTLHRLPLVRLTTPSVAVQLLFSFNISCTIYLTLPLPPQPPGPINRELHSSRPDHYIQEIQTQTTEAHSAVISSPIVAVVLLRIFTAVVYIYISIHFHFTFAIV
jgi:hypothetical protein